MQDVRSGVHQRHQPVGHRIGRFGQACGEILLLPLAEAEDDGIAGTHGTAHGLDYLGREAGALLQGNAAIPVGARVGAPPEKLVDQVAVSAVYLGHVEAQPLGIAGGAGKGGNRVGNGLLAHRIPARLARSDQAGRAFHGDRGRPIGLEAHHGAGVPKLRPHPAACSVDLIDHPLPARKRGVAVEEGYARVVSGLIRNLDAAYGADGCPGAHSMNISESMLSRVEASVAARAVRPCGRSSPTHP